MNNVSKDAWFVLRDVAPSHEMLNIRHSGRADDGEPGSLDIVFAGVKYVELPFYFRGFEFGTPTEAEQRYLASRCQMGSGLNEFVIVSGNARYFIVASGFYVDRNGLPLSKSALDRDFEEAAERTRKAGPPPQAMGDQCER